MKKKRIIVPVIGLAILFVIGFFLSSLIYKSEIIQLESTNNIYYIFSTGAQTIASLVGFVLAAYTFNHQLVSSQKDDNDEAKSQVIETIISRNYINIFILTVFTGLTLIADLFVLRFNAIDTSIIKTNIYIVISSMNIALIMAAVIVALYTIRPIDTRNLAVKLLNEDQERMRKDSEKLHKKAEKLRKRAEGFTKEAEKLLVESEKLNKQEKHKEREHEKEWGNSVNTMEFLQLFIKLEKLVKDFLLERQMLDYRKKGMGNMARQLFERAIIDGATYKRLITVSRTRNLIVHGEVSEIEEDLYYMLENLYEDIETMLDIQQ